MSKPHNAVIAEVVQLSDGAVAIRARCCDDVTSDSWHTQYDLHKLSVEELKSLANQHVANVAAKHESMQSALSVLKQFLEGK